MSPRVKTGVVAGSGFLAVLLFGGPGLFGALVAAAAAVGVYEYGRIVSPGANPLEEAFAVAWGAVVVLGFGLGLPAVPAALLALGALVYWGARVFTRGPTPQSLVRWGAVLGGWVFVAFFLGHVVWIRQVGVGPVLFLLAIVWAGDTAAYYVGTAFGSRPLAPSVSPNKSVEGALASLGGALLAAALLGLVLPLPHSLPASLALGVLLNAAAQLGDLAESLLKRCGGVKDSGALFPGHGGILDRVDGFLPSVPLYAGFLALLGGCG